MLSSLSKAYVVLAVLSLGAWVGFAHIAHRADLLGDTLLLSLCFASMLGATLAAQRSVAGSDLARPAPNTAPVSAPPAPSGLANRPSVWPIVAAIGTALMALGAGVGKGALIGGIAMIVIAGGGWLGQTWREHLSWTDRFSDRISSRAVSPVGYPALAVLLGALVAISISRLYLTVSEHAAVAVSVAVAGVIFLLCVVVAYGRQIGPRATAAMAGVAAVAVLASGVAGATNGTRTIEKPALPYTKVFLPAQGTTYGRGTQITQLTFTEGVVKFTFHNYDADGTYHDVGVYSDVTGGTPYVEMAPVNGGHKATVEIDTRKAGLVPGHTYTFRCDFHPAMVGTLFIVPAPATTTEGK